MSKNVPRYGQEGTDKTPVTVTNGTNSFALKAVVSDEAKAAAEELPLVISGNTAQYGGGVGSNGGVTIGVENVTITPADITVYMGGSAGYEGVTDDGGQIVGSSSLPMPGFTFDGLPEGADPTKLTLIGEDGSSWTVEPYPGLPEDAKRPLYTFNAVGGSHEVRIQFINADEEVVTFDDFEVGSVVNQTLKMTLYPESIRGVTARYGDAIFSIVPGEGTLTVRGTTENVEYGYVNREPEAGSPGVTAATDTQFTINGSEIVSSDSVALLFDDIIESGPGAVTNKAPLREAALNVLGSGDWSFEYKYLDLVERDNGDAWVEASGPVTVYWPRPEEAPDDAQFALLHFEGLHRSESDGGYELVAVPLSESEDGERLCFTIAPGGFSPFVLAWKAPQSPNLPPVEPSEPEYVPDWLNTKDHFAYIIGYEDGTVRPYGSITRAEVATIFFRLLTDEAREESWCEVNSYSDVGPDDWFNNAVSTLSGMGILGGYEDGTFRPDAGITRAEFAKIAVSFFEYEDAAAENIFTDVAEGSWYESFIAAAAQLGLIEGYEDGSFRPDTGITRAEACTIINRTLRRAPDKDHLLPESEMRVWPDNPEEAWFYAQVQEATNSHEYRWLGSIEQWTGKMADRDWTQLEK